jgi:hypothetical protein
LSPKEGLWKVPVGAVVPFLVVIALAILQRDTDTQVMILYFGTMFASLCGSVLILLSRFDFSVEDGNPDEVLSQLAHSLRASMFIVKEEKFVVNQDKSSISVSINSTAAVKIRARPSDGGTVVSYSPNATRGGWNVYFIFLVFAYGSILLLPMAIYLFLKARTTAHELVLPKLRSKGAVPKRTEELGVCDVLVDSLSEGRRMAMEAHEAAKSNYEDEVILSFIGSIAVFIFAGVGLLYLLPSGRDAGTTLFRVALALALAAGFGFAAIHYLRKTRRPRINEFKAWGERLRKVLDLETSAQVRGENSPSALELLLETSLELPKWEKARVQGAAYLYPGIWMIIFGCAYVAFWGALGLLSAYNDFGAILVSASFLVWGILLGALYYLQWKKKVREDQEFSQAWKARVRVIESDMEKILGGM